MSELGAKHLARAAWEVLPESQKVILIRAHTKKYTKGDSIKKFIAGYVGRPIRTICKKFGENRTNGTGNID